MYVDLLGILQGEVGKPGAAGYKGDSGVRVNIPFFVLVVLFQAIMTRSLCCFLKGSKGSAGLPGSPGPVGQKGVKGDDGFRGPRGPKGRVGERGPSGNPGPDVSMLLLS